MTAQWTIDDESAYLSWATGHVGITSWDEPDAEADAHIDPEAFAALVADVRAARLVDDMAAVVAKLEYVLAEYDDAPYGMQHIPMSNVVSAAREVAALHHARQQDDR